jgi:hypothetical protein
MLVALQFIQLRGIHLAVKLFLKTITLRVRQQSQTRPLKHVAKHVATRSYKPACGVSFRRAANTRVNTFVAGLSGAPLLQRRFALLKMGISPDLPKLPQQAWLQDWRSAVST